MKKTVPRQYILLDTNILQYLANKHISEKLIPFITTLLDLNFELALSEISICESLSGVTLDQEKRALDTLAMFQRYLVDQTILLGAARLQNIYKTEKIPDGKINLADRVIAATSIIGGFLILTADINDFPRPLFKEIHEEKIIYRKKNKSNLMVIQLLEPNIPLIKHRLNERE